MPKCCPFAVKVITLSDSSLLLSCRALADQIASSSFDPDLVIGIASGGVTVAHHIAERLGIPLDRRDQVTRRRPGTKLKNRSSIAKLLKCMPIHLANGLRVVENFIGQLRGARFDDKAVAVSEVAGRLIAISSSILVVDDAVDSGVTLQAVVGAIRGINPRASVASAALVLTRPNALLKPDFVLHRYRLARFPWSSDARRSQTDD